MIKIYNSALVEQASVNQVITCEKTERINSDNVLNFSLPLTTAVTALINANNVIGLDGDYFDIARYVKQDTGGQIPIVNVECEHVSYRLNDPAFDVEYFTQIGTPTEILTAILNGTGFTIDTVDFATEVTFSLQEATSRRSLLMQFVAYLGGEVSFSAFTVSILTRRGSATAKDLTGNENITIVSKSLDKRTLDSEGDPSIAYSCEITEPTETFALGDDVIIEYDLLDIDVQLRIVSITTNPYLAQFVQFEVGNYINALEDDLYRIETEKVGKDALMNGCRIGPTYGFEAVRNDKKARAYFKSDGMAFQAGDGTGTTWVDKLYYDYDSETGESILVFDGELSADIINALSVLITPNLYTEKATIAELTVDRLETSDKVQKYLGSDTSDVNYVKIYDQYIEFITAVKNAGADVQATDRNATPLYWIDETHQAATTTETAYPVMMYAYDELVKLSFSFELDGETYIPKVVLGAGTGTGDNGKGFVYKGTNGLYIEYISTTGESRIIQLTDDGIDLTDFEAITYSETVLITGVPQIWVDATTPAGAKIKDVWVDTDDYSRYDMTALTEGITLDVSANEFITANGTFTITLHAGTASGIIKKIYNIGTGIITIAGTINGVSGMKLYPTESVELITDGTNWRA